VVEEVATEVAPETTEEVTPAESENK